VFGREAIGFALIRPEGSGLTVLQAREISAGQRLDPADRTSVVSVARTVKDLTAELANRYLPLHVSLADSLARVTVLELESLPADRAAQRSLASFRVERDLGHKPAGLDCQPLGSDDGHSLLLAASLDDDWAGYISNILIQAGLAPVSLGANLLCQFNRFHDRLVKNGQGGALLSLVPDCWSVLIWDTAGRPRVVRSRARTAGASDSEAIAGDLERLILAYVHGGANRHVEAIHVLADDPAMANALDRRLKTPSLRIDPYEQCRWAGNASAPAGATIPMALAAALSPA